MTTESGYDVTREVVQRYDVAYRVAPVAFITWDADGRITDWNPRAEEVFGWSRDEAIGQNLFELLVPPELSGEIAALAETLKRGQATVRSVNENLTKEGKRIVCSWSSAILRTEGGDFAGAVSLALDVTDQERVQRALIESMRNGSALIDASSDILILLDPDGTVAAANRAAAEHCGCRKDELIGTCVFDYFEPEVAAERRARVAKAAEQGAQIRFVDTRKGVTLENAVVPVLDDNGTVVNVAVFARDITELRRAQADLVASEERYRTFFERVPAALYRSKPTGEILDANPALVRLLGYGSRASLLNVNSHKLWVDLDEQSAVAAMLKVQGGIRDMEYRLKRADGTPVWVRDNCSAVRNDRGEIIYYEGVLVDISEQKEAEEQLIRLAHHDKLTGLYNRSRFDEELRRALARSSRYDEHGALAYIDLDNFKDVNDQYGHQVGDLVLAAVARRLKERLRETDVLARLGGDEFIVLMPDADSDSSVLVANQLLMTLSGVPIEVGGYRFTMRASVGISLFPSHASTSQELMAMADKAMYIAKSQGGDTAELFALAES